ncbi:hypothetical protein [Arcobacter sp. CECT 8983]|uniref:hypothetical protein n=1 Tax=Arcobacter sp. CECT 8983 TaxID=2044508 RepID=UPI002159CFC0|nr:hypothetical protein [Arcobacter sp. CECT 8983]
MENIKIHDIKSLVDIPDFSIYIYILLISVAVFLVFLLLFLIYKIIRNRKKDFRKDYYKILEEIDFEDSKKTAYTITKYSRLLAVSQREKKLAEELIDELEKYKYKKDVKQIDEDIKILFSRFMDSVDV